jgi:hypothetical protein
MKFLINKAGFIAFLTLATLPVHALERTAALPYDYSKTITRNVFVPNCTPNQFVGVSGSMFVCRDIPTCSDSQYLKSSNGTFTCVDMPTTSEQTTGALCGFFTQNSQCSSTSNGSSSGGSISYSILQTCPGMQTTSWEYRRINEIRCPSGYTLSVMNDQRGQPQGCHQNSYSYVNFASCTKN